ncbi:MAG: excinuclease ABC subunit UvrC [Candidatus Heimdallarchaeota archaeon]
MPVESFGEKHILKEQLAVLPDSAGVYLFRGEDGEVLYIGKALSLKKRVASFFQAPDHLPIKIQALMEHVTDFEFIAVESEHQALLLESSLIKEYEPRFNVRLKDHKSFPYIKVTVNEEYPRFFVTRKVEEDGGRYFGPFTDVKAARKSVRLLRSIFPVRSYCRMNGRLCLDYHIGKCSGPCEGKITAEEYKKLVAQILSFLDGKGEDLLRELEEQMHQAADNLDYERAAVLRDRIKALNKTLERQNITSPFIRDQDIIALAQAKNRASVQIFFRRDGRIIGRQTLFLEGVSEESDQELIGIVIKQYYAGSTYIPGTILLQGPVRDEKTIKQWLSQKRGDSVNLITPMEGTTFELVQMAEKNAKLALKHYELKLEKEHEMAEGALADLQTALELLVKPRRIEAFDISNIGGTAASGSMIVLEDGKPKKTDYRHYKIRTVQMPDDVAMMTELLRRRYQPSPQKEAVKKPMPDLIVVDGGKGQLNAAVKILDEVGLKTPIIGLAKRFEHIFIPGRSDPKVLREDSNALFLLQRLRDEAHRFAIRYHHILRDKKIGKSALDEIVGIGEKRKRILFQYFGSIDRIQTASLEELTRVPGIDRKVARAILLHFQKLKKA